VKNYFTKKTNRSTLNYLNMETPYLVPLGSFFLWWISDREKNIHFVEDLLMNIPAKFGSTRPSVEREED
jgi:hypothetical protein